MIGLFIGTRPELIKLRSVFYELRRRQLPVHVIYTGQHAGISDEIARLDPEATFTVVMPDRNAANSDLFGHQIQLIPKLLGVGADPLKAGIVQGDTTTAAAAALHLAYQQIPVIHVEAGLRSYDKEPFPEELNRRLISHVASLHLCPTLENVQNLAREGITENVHKTGNPGITELLGVLDNISTEDTIIKYNDPSVARILVTCHRRENWPHIRTLALQLDQLARTPRWKTEIRWVMHPNPKLRESIPITETVADGRLKLLPPQSHRDLIKLMLESDLIVTDSGGMIEEATYLNKRLAILRCSTERPEANAAFAPIDEGLRTWLDNEMWVAKREDRKPFNGVFGNRNSALQCAAVIETFVRRFL